MIFEENYKPIEISVKAINGKEYLLQSNFLSSGETKKLEELSRDPKITESEKIHKLCSAYFNKDEKFFRQFSLELLGRIADHVQDMQKKN